MPTNFLLRDYFFDDAGLGVGGIRVRIYKKQSDGSRIAIPELPEITSTNGTGEWKFPVVNPALSPETGVFSLEFYNPSTGQVRRREGDVALQVQHLVGANGDAPLSPGSISTNLLQDGAVTSVKVATVERTIDPAIASTAAHTGTLGQLFSWIAREIKAIKGTADWKSAPATTLSAVFAHMSAGNPHNTTSADVGAVANAGSTPSIRTGSIISRPVVNNVTGSIYIDTSNNIIYQYRSGQWQKIGVGSYRDLDDKPVAATSNYFSTIKVGSTNISATVPGDTVQFLPGINTTLTAVTSNKSIQFASTGSGGGGGGTGAHTHTADEVVGEVDSADKLNNIAGYKFPYVADANPSVGNWTTQQLKIAGGSELSITDSNGRAYVSLPTNINGIITLIAQNGDYGAVPYPVELDDTDTGLDWFRIKVHGPSAAYQDLRVNWLLLYW